jgi:tripartite ATP-independent transporter DctM subunit
MGIPELTTALRRSEDIVSVIVLTVMSVLPLAEFSAREFMGTGIPGSISMVQHFTLWITFLGAVLAARSDRLLALSTGEFLSQPWRRRARVLTSALGVAVTGCLLLASLQLIVVDYNYGDVVSWGIPVWVLSSIMPLGFALMVARLIWHAAADSRGRLVAAFGLVIPVVLGVLIDAPGPVMMWGVGLALLLGMALGMPIYAVIGGAALLLFWQEGTPISAVPGETYRLSTEAMLPAIPLFTVAGYVLAEGGASKRLLRLFSAMVGWMPGGLAIVTTLVLAFFTPLTGASGITILAMGGVLLPMLLSARYKEQESVGLVTVSGSIGVLLPPSLPVILYAYYAELDLERLFIGGLLPGILLILVVAGWGAWCGWKGGAIRTPFRSRELYDALREAKWEIMLPLVILVGIFGGFATLVEAAALTVLYAVLIVCVIHREVSLTRDIIRVMVESATMVGGFMIILGVALGFTNYLVIAQIPMHALDWVQQFIQSPYLFLLVVNIVLIIAGAFMDIYSAIIVIVPLIAPMAAAYAVEPVHLGVIFLANLQLGYLTPPVGVNLFLSAYRFKKPLARIYRSTFPYLVILLMTALLITYVPALTLWLPALLLD